MGEFGDGVLEALQGFSDGFGHGYVDVVFWLVPIDGQSAVLSARWFDGDGVMLSERIEEVGGVVGGKELDATVVYIKGEGGGKDIMGPKARGIFHRGVSMGLEVAYNAFLGNDDGFLDAIHPLSDLDVDIDARVSDGEEGVFDNHLVGDAFEMDPHVLEVGHRVIEVAVDDVCSDVAGPFAGVGDDGVEVDLEVQ